MQAGKLQHRIALQSSSVAADTFGEPIQTWTTYGTVWADVQPFSGRERLYAQQAGAETNYRVIIRYNSSVLPTHRVYWGTKYLEINAVINTGANNEQMELMCKEIL